MVVIQKKEEGHAEAMYYKELSDIVSVECQREATFREIFFSQQGLNYVEIDLGQVDIERLTRNGQLYVSKKLASSLEVSWKTTTAAD